MFKNFNNVGYIKRKLSKKTMKVLEKAIKKLGFETEIDLEESVEEVIAWMRKQHEL